MNQNFPLKEPPQPNTERRICKICKGDSALFDIVDFGKTCQPDRYPLGLTGIGIKYFRCCDCAFIFSTDFDDFTPENWRDIVYNNDYEKIDPEYNIERPTGSYNFIESQFSKAATIGLDFGGGSGYMAQKLRQNGWVYDSYDPYGSISLDQKLFKKYNLCSAFEVFEHTPDPLKIFRDILSFVSSEKFILIVGTLINDTFVSSEKRLDWWYAAPRNGHISLFSRDALRRAAGYFDLDYSSFGESTHYFTRGWQRAEVIRRAYIGKARRQLADTWRRFRGASSPNKVNRRGPHVE
jgi:hypothetical protein